MLNMNDIWKEIVNNNGIDAFLVTTPSNIKYILGIEIEGYILIEANAVSVITDGRYVEAVNKYVFDNDCVQVYNMSLLETKQKIVELFESKKIGIEKDNMTLGMIERFQKIGLINYIPCSNVIENIRVIKNNFEIDNIKKACEITDQAFSYMVGFIERGMTEKQIQIELEYFMKKLGAEDISFSAIVASGENSSKPHATATERKIQDKDIILLDFGCKYNGYCSDMSRIIFVGQPTKRQVEIYELVREAQMQAINLCRKGVNVKDIDNVVHEIYQKYDFDKNYLHSTGHGVGLDVHEIPNVSNRVGEYILNTNMIITVEPGIYFENDFGIRIEDTIHITEYGCDVLTNSSKEIICI